MLLYFGKLNQIKKWKTAVEKSTDGVKYQCEILVDNGLLVYRLKPHRREEPASESCSAAPSRLVHVFYSYWKQHWQMMWLNESAISRIFCFGRSG